MGNRYRNSPGYVRLHVQGGGRGRRARQHPVWAGILLAVVALLVTAAVGYAGLLLVGNAVFQQNDRFQIETIEIQPGVVKTDPIIREYLEYIGIHPGANLFSFEIGALTDLYLERNPLVRAVRVERVLPGTLRFSVWEREPLARLGQRGTLVVDRQGFVYRLRQGLHGLPVIIERGETKWAPGETVHGMVSAALEVIEVCDDPRVGLRVMGVDIQHPDYLLVHFLTPDGIKETRLLWEDMGANSEASRRDLLLRLEKGVRQAALEDRSGRTLFDATIPGRISVR